MPRAQKQATAAKRAAFSVRVTQLMRDQLGEAAAAAGRSVAQEIELRLERSFWRETTWGNDHIERLLRAMVPVLQQIEDEAGGQPWTDDPGARDMVRAKIPQFLEFWGTVFEGA